MGGRILGNTTPQVLSLTDFFPFNFPINSAYKCHHLGETWICQHCFQNLCKVHHLNLRWWFD